MNVQFKSEVDRNILKTDRNLLQNFIFLNKSKVILEKIMIGLKITEIKEIPEISKM